VVLDSVTARPRPELAAVVGRLVGVRSSGPPERHAEPAVPGTALILTLEHDWLVAPAGDAPMRRVRSFVGGISTAPARSAHQGDVHVLQADLTPLGTAAVLGVPGAALAGQVVDFADVVGDREADELVGRLVDAPGWAGRFAVLEDWMVRRLRTAGVPRADVAWAVARLDATGGKLRIEQLRRELGCSRRHLSSRFCEAVGVGPKAYARLVRFDRARHAIRERTDGLAAIAAAHGFSDQAHLTREFQALAGRSPASLRPRPPVTNLQEGARSRT
jgi:AraC-like DNA-binding protein